MRWYVERTWFDVKKLFPFTKGLAVDICFLHSILSIINRQIVPNVTLGTFERSVPYPSVGKVYNSFGEVSVKSPAPAFFFNRCTPPSGSRKYFLSRSF